MMILVTYDVDTTSPVGEKRLRKVSKLCMDYGQRVQNSVFECVLHESQFIIFKHQLESLIDEELDSIRFYFMGKNWDRHIEMIGKKTSYNINGALII